MPVLEAVPLPAKARSLDAWAKATGRNPETVRRLNPAFVGGVIRHGNRDQRVLAPKVAPTGPESPAQAH